MRVLISAYACEPGRGSEPEVGFQVLLAAASAHEVWVLTRTNNVPSLNAFLSDEPELRKRVHLVGLEAPGLALRWKHRGLPFLHWYYHSWQQEAAKVALRLNQTIGFDVVHHATFAAHWLRTGVKVVDKPFVWGPVGGGARTPFLLLPVLGFKGVLSEGLRGFARPIIATMNRAPATANQAAVVFAQNAETLKALGSPPHGKVFPNALAVRVDSLSVEQTESRDIVFACRLIPWKAATLAIRSIRHLQTEGATLHMFGDGPDRSRVQRLIDKWHLERSVVLHGRVARKDLLRMVGRAGAFLHPALHDEASLAVAEALTLNTPVVCLDHAGPPTVANAWPTEMSICVAPSTPNSTARSLAEALDSVLDQAPRTEPISGPDFQATLLQAYEDAAKS